MDPQMSSGRETHDLATRRGVSLTPEDDRIAREMAERHHGGNISRLIRRLLRDAWAIEQTRESERRAA